MILKEILCVFCVAVHQELCKIELMKSRLALTYFKVPVVYKLTSKEKNLGFVRKNDPENFIGSSLLTILSNKMFSKSKK